MCSSNLNPVDLIFPGAGGLAKKGTQELTKALTPDINIPATPAPPMSQDAKTPDASTLRRRRPLVSSTLLTGPAGVTGGALNTGAPTLLGG